MIELPLTIGRIDTEDKIKYSVTSNFPPEFLDLPAKLKTIIAGQCAEQLSSLTALGLYVDNTGLPTPLKLTLTINFEKPKKNVSNATLMFPEELSSAQKRAAAAAIGAFLYQCAIQFAAKL